MEHLISLLLLSIISALVGFGFKRMQDPYMIFYLYGHWLDYLAEFQFKTFRYKTFLLKNWWNTRRPHSRRFKFNFSDDSFAMTDFPARRKSRFLYYITKPIGRCIICNTTWIGMLLAFIFFRDLPLLFLNIIIVGVVSAGIVVMISNKYELMQNAL